MKPLSVKNLALSAMLMGVGLILPLFIGQIPQVGNMLLPMHIPVLLCGLICGWQYGAIVGFILPCLRYMIFGMPVLVPMGVSMSFELATYGFVTGWIYKHSKWQCVFALYRSMIIAMLSGRVVWGLVRFLIGCKLGEPFTWQMFMAGAFFNAVPGIVCQLILIPAIMLALRKNGLIPYQKGKDMSVKS